MNFFKSASFWIVLGSVALALALFLGLKYIGLTDVFTRILCSALVVVLGFSISLIIKFRSLKSIQTQQNNPNNFSNGSNFQNLWADSAQIEISEALQLLGKVKTGKGKKTNSKILESRKFFLVLGNDSSGKSSLIEYSGSQYSRYPTERQKAERTYQFFDWFYDTHNVFMEAPTKLHSSAGTQEDDEFSTCLKILRKEGKDKAIDGILVTVSLKDLTTSFEDIQVKGVHLNAQISSALKALELNTPVYVCLTHFDILPGFKEYFSFLKGPERDQIFGASLNIFNNPKPIGDRFNGEFEKLFQNVRNKTLSIMQSSLLPKDRQAVFQFHTEFFAMKEKLSAYITALFKRDVQKEVAYFRGFYFTSIFSENRDVQNFESPLIENNANFLTVEAGNPNLPSQTIISHPFNPRKNQKQPIFLKSYATKAYTSYFVTLLFNGVIKNDVNLSSYAKYRRMNMSRKSFTLSILIFSGAFLLILYSLAGLFNASVPIEKANGHILAAVKLNWNKSSAFKQSFSSLNEVGLYIDTLQTYHDKGSPWSIPPGFYFGNKSLGQLKNVYYHQFYRFLTKNVISDLKGALYYSSYSSPETKNALYFDLMLYLALTDLGKPYRKEMDPELLTKLLSEKWLDYINEKFPSANKPANYERLVEINAARYIRELLKGDLPTSGLKGFLGDHTSVENARNELNGSPSPSSLYHSMVQSAKGFSDMTLQSMGINTSGLLQNEGNVHGFYTKEGFESKSMDLINNTAEIPFIKDWVLGENQGELPPEMQDERQLKRILISMYYEQYIAVWQSFLSSMVVVVPPDLKSFSTKLTGFASQSQGLETVLRRVLDEVNLVKEKNKDVERVLDRKLKNSLAGKFAREKIDEMADPKKDVLAAFSDISLLVGSDQGAQGLLKNYLDGISRLGESLNNLTLEDNEGTATLNFLKDVFTNKPANPLVFCWTESERILEQVSENTKVWLQPLLQNMLITAAQNLTEQAQADLRKSYDREVYKPYVQLFYGKYPFDRNSGREVNLEDLNRYFNADNGAFNKFFKNNIEPFLRVQEGNFESKHWNGIKLKFSKQALLTFNQGNALTAKLYQSLARQLKQFPVNYTLVKSSNTETVVFEMSGKKITVDEQNPKLTQKIMWPDENVQEGVILNVILPGNKSEKMVITGPWGIFRLIDKARTFHHHSKGFRTSYRVRVERKYEVEVVLEGEVFDLTNPFTQKDFYAFEAASELLDRNSEVTQSQVNNE